MKLLYGIAAQRGLVPANPVTLASPTDVKTSDMKWLSPRAFRLWRNVGLGGMLPSGLEDEVWRGRSAGRDTAYADLMYSSGLRRREGGTLLLCELPALGRRNYYPGKVGQAVAKRAGYTFYLGHPALQRVEGYRMSTRALTVVRARRRGVYDRLPDLRIIQTVSQAGRVQWRSRDGRTGESALGRLTAAERMLLFVDGEDGLEPAMLWLTESGLPLQDTHERDYQLEDEGVRAASRGAVELGLAQALASARHTVAMRLVEEVDAQGEVSTELVAKEAGIDVEVARRIVAGRLRTPVASCADFLNSDHSVAGMPCAVSFLLYFACRNAVATGRDLPRIAYLHQALEFLRSAVTPAVWVADWATHHARIGDFLTTYTTTDARPQLVAAVADSERELIHAMLERRLDP